MVIEDKILSVISVVANLAAVGLLWGVLEALGAGRGSGSILLTGSGTAVVLVLWTALLTVHRARLRARLADSTGYDALAVHWKQTSGAAVSALLWVTVLVCPLAALTSVLLQFGSGFEVGILAAWIVAEMVFYAVLP